MINFINFITRDWKGTLILTYVDNMNGDCRTVSVCFLSRTSFAEFSRSGSCLLEFCFGLHRV